MNQLTPQCNVHNLSSHDKSNYCNLKDEINYHIMATVIVKNQSNSKKGTKNEPNKMKITLSKTSVNHTNWDWFVTLLQWYKNIKFDPHFQVLGILAEPVETARAHSITYSILFLVVGCIVGLAMFLQVINRGSK